VTSYTLTGTGIQALSSNVTAFNVTISTPPLNPGSGSANPLDYYGVGFLRPGTASAFWDPFTISGGPQWLPCPFGATRVGYSLLNGAVITLAEVFGPSPLAVPLAQLPDVALSSPTDTQILTYQASSSKWINAAAPTGGGGATGDYVKIGTVITASHATTVSFSSIPGTYAHLECRVHSQLSTGAANLQLRFNGDTAAHYNWRIYQRGFGGPGDYNENGDGFGMCGDARANGFASTISIPGYKDAIPSRSWTGNSSAWAGSTDVSLSEFAGIWTQSAAITSITFFLNSAAFLVDGSTFSLYGIN